MIIGEGKAGVEERKENLAEVRHEVRERSFGFLDIAGLWFSFKVEILKIAFCLCERTCEFYESRIDL